MIARLARWLFPADPDNPATPLLVGILLIVVVVAIARRMVG